MNWILEEISVFLCVVKSLMCFLFPIWRSAVVSSSHQTERPSAITCDLSTTLQIWTPNSNPNQPDWEEMDGQRNHSIKTCNNWSRQTIKQPIIRSYGYYCTVVYIQSLTALTMTIFQSWQPERSTHCRTETTAPKQKQILIKMILNYFSERWQNREGRHEEHVKRHCGQHPNF